MHPVLKRVLQSKFARSVFVVASGTAAAQAINVAFMPLLTRLYGPEAFGLLGTFVSLAAMIAPLVALSYPIAIVLPRHDRDATGLAWLSFKIALVMSCIAFVALVLFKDALVAGLQLHAIESFLYLLPLAMFFAGCLAIFQQWVIRKKLFKLKARVAVLQSLWLNLAKTGAGLVYPVATVLVALGAIASGLHAAMLAIGLKRKRAFASSVNHSASVNHSEPVSHSDSERRSNTEKHSNHELLELAKAHKDFPLYRTPQVFLNSVSQSMPVLMLAAFFGPAAAGFYTLSKTVLALPITLIGGAIASVFYPHINEAVLAGRSPFKPLLKATSAIAVLGGLPFLIIGVFGPYLFQLIFGEQWEMAGEYARWLSLWYFFGFINRPSVGAIAVLRLQRFFLVYEILSVALRAAALYIGFILFADDVVAVALFAVVSALLNFLLVVTTLSYAKRFKHE